MYENIEIPNRSHFKIQEVCALTNVRPYVLKYWESEFPEISPLTSSSGQKLYEYKDIEIIAFVKNLLFKKDMTIEQAKAEVKLNSLQLLEKKNLSKNQNEVSLPISTLNEDILILARNKLNALLILTQSLKERYNWD